MADEAIELIETPETCDLTTEYDNPIEEEEVEIEPDEEYTSVGGSTDWDGLEKEFSRFESNYRARRIRELTAPFKRGRSRRNRSDRKVAA